MTDEDIDAIIAKGEQETADLNNKLQEYTENAMKFTMDGGTALWLCDVHSHRQLVASAKIPRSHVIRPSSSKAALVSCLTQWNAAAAAVTTAESCLRAPKHI